MQAIKNRINTKYRLLEYNDEDLHNYLQDENNYYEFIQTLSNILITEPNYDFYIYERNDFINKEIKFHNQDLENSLYEDFIQKKIKTVEKYGRSDKSDFKTQYAYFYAADIKLPHALREEMLFAKIVKENYENFAKIEKVINNHDEELKESLKGNLSSLITINSILYENAVVDEALISLFEEISKAPIERENFEDNLSYLYCKMYQYKTIKAIKQFKDKKEEVKQKTFC